jgi:5-methylcytosine-specific restriction endonuclease McrA
MKLTLDTSTMDHVIPLHRGGLDNANNRVLACEPCNSKRGHDMPELKR